MSAAGLTSYAGPDRTSSTRRIDVRVGPEPADTAPPRRLPTVVRVFLGVVMMVLATAAPLLVQVVPGTKGWVEGGPTWHELILGVPSFLLACGAAVLLVRLAMRYVDRRPFGDVGLRWDRRSLPSLLLAVAGTVFVCLVVDVLVQRTGVLRAGEALPKPTWFGLSMALAMAFLLQGFPEELVWRGYVMQTLRTPARVSALISAAVFAVPHLLSYGGQENLVEHVLYLALPFGFALLAAAMMLRTGSLWAAVGVHGGVHTSNALAAIWLGLGNGPALWMAQGATMTVLALVLLRGVPDGRGGNAADAAGQSVQPLTGRRS